MDEIPTCYKKQINGRKTDRHLIACILPVCIGDSQENWVTPWYFTGHHLKYHHQVKTKKDIGVEGGYQAMHSKEG